MTAHQLLKTLRDHNAIPQSRERSKLGLPSNAELFRWLRNGSVSINNIRIQIPNESISFPVEQLSFFKGKNKVTIK